MSLSQGPVRAEQVVSGGSRAWGYAECSSHALSALLVHKTQTLNSETRTRNPTAATARPKNPNPEP